MALTYSSMLDLQTDLIQFNLLNSLSNSNFSSDLLDNNKPSLIMFICNHCPYVKAIILDIVNDCKKLKNLGINSLAICSNDVDNYPEDSFENMIEFSKNNEFNFPYVHDETQDIANKYGAVCTPDFFGYNKNLELQYRGRIRELKDLKPVRDGDSELFIAMKRISESGVGPKNQIPSMGCNIKWK